MATIYPGPGGRVNFGDSIKWQYLHFVNGLPHGTGYPQFLILTELFYTTIWFLDGPERITFISVFFGALSLSIFYSLILLLTESNTGSFITTIFTGLTYVFWTQATEAEVYTLNIFYLLAVFYLFIKFYKTKNIKYFFIGCAVYAFSFGNHLSMITILPAVAFIILFTDYKVILKVKNVLIVLLFVVIGMLQYGLIYYRAHNSDIRYMEIPFKPDFEVFLTYITGTDKSSMFAFTFQQIIYHRFPILLNFLNDNFTIFGLILASTGFFYFKLVKKQYIISIFLLLALIGQVTFNISYNVPDLIVFFIPVYIIIGIFIGLTFSIKNNWFPKFYLILLTLLIVNHNLRFRDIYLPHDFLIFDYKPIFDLYQAQEENFPLYYKDNGYHMKNYIDYINNSGYFNSKSIHPILGHLFSDTFFVADYNEIRYPELTDGYKVELVAANNLDDFIKKYNQSNYVIFFSVMDEASERLPLEFINYMKRYGSNIDTLPYRASYAALLYNGQLMEKMNETEEVIISSEEIENNILSEFFNFKIISGGNLAGSSSEIWINSIDYSYKRRGINLAVFDVETLDMVELATYDTHLGQERKLYKAIKVTNHLLEVKLDNSSLSN